MLPESDGQTLIRNAPAMNEHGATTGLEHCAVRLEVGDCIGVLRPDDDAWDQSDGVRAPGCDRQRPVKETEQLQLGPA